VTGSSGSSRPSTTKSSTSEPADAQALKAAIRAEAAALGFDVCRFATAELPAQTSARYRTFLDRGYHGTMDWLARTPERRERPRGLWPEARSVVVVAMSYTPEGDALAGLQERNRGNLSVYARGRDYHDVVKPRLKRLARWLHDRHGAGVKVFVDTAPVLEKPLAQRAGVGWQGKHTNLLGRDVGNWFFLGEMFTDLDLPADPAESDHCGSCRACLDICPTRAFPAPYVLDARRCISYLTIEHEGHIALEFREAIGNRIYGCDDCLAVCPWNKYAKQGRETGLQAREDLRAPTLRELVALDDAGFRARFRGTAIKRLGRDRFVRNVLIAVGNSDDPDLAEVAHARLGDPSALVRAMAAWALRRLVAPEAWPHLRAYFTARERDTEVMQEWHR
jgi:epoxyqueuosine reductase